MRALTNWLGNGARLAVLAACGVNIFAQIAPKPETANIEVAAVDESGNLPKNTDVYSFIDENGNDRVALFHHDRATGVPYGRYVVSVQASGGFRESVFAVEVSTPEMRVTAALRWYGIENSLSTGRLRGKIVGYVPKEITLRCRASGLYSRDQFDSVLSASEMAFDFGEVPSGYYNLTCIDGKQVVAVRVVLAAWPDEPITIRYSQIEGLEKLR